ncbi:ABC transporter substrate-binding protein [Psychrobacillus sp. OK032]|uniref:ABC transporter substrate-binding protein n=1 Tax=Psychrobacillus sp. OK032 TaxID=1884358 RepID=UPI0008AD53C4|nr:ABC transporter substrate-binding protein [Psychrobacillus sp. OK032]SES38467.1 putative spermidine/putrescine transport system substrate-binding protein [Psychrobacillus sp. OK032]
MPKKLGLFFVALLVALIVAGCGGEASGDTDKKNKELVVVDWGGPYTEVHKKVSFEPFEKEHGVKVTVVTPPDIGKLKAMVQSGNVEWDVVSVGNDFAIRGGEEGLLEKLDFNVISTEGLPKELVHDYGVPENMFSTVIAYNTEAFPADKQPKNWADFWDTEKFPGPRGLYKDPMWTLEAALLADGVDPANLYPLDVDRAFAKLDELKDDIKVWWTAGAQPPELLATNEVPLTSAWSGRITVAADQGAPVKVDFNQGFMMSNSWAVPKGAPNKDLAMKFIAFTLAPEQQAGLSSQYDNGPANTDAIPLLSEESVNRLGLSSDQQEQQVFVNSGWWVENYDKVNERFQQWLLE